MQGTDTKPRRELTSKAQVHVSEEVLKQLVQDLEKEALDVFGKQDLVNEWMVTHLAELDDLTPNQALASYGRVGFDYARKILIRLDYGVFA